MVVFLIYSVLGWDKSNGGKISDYYLNIVADVLVWFLFGVVLVAFIQMIYMVAMKIWFTIKKCIDGKKLKPE